MFEVPNVEDGEVEFDAAKVTGTVGKFAAAGLTGAMPTRDAELGVEDAVGGGATLGHLKKA